MSYVKELLSTKNRGVIVINKHKVIYHDGLKIVEDRLRGDPVEKAARGYFESLGDYTDEVVCFHGIDEGAGKYVVTIGPLGRFREKPDALYEIGRKIGVNLTQKQLGIMFDIVDYKKPGRD